MNKVIISGRIAKDFVLRYTTEKNTAVLTLTLAVQRTKTDADFIQVVAYGKNAELIDKYCKKGSPLYIFGQLRVRNYDDKDGKRVFVTEVIVDEIEFAKRSSADEPITEPISDEELPF